MIAAETKWFLPGVFTTSQATRRARKLNRAKGLALTRRLNREQDERDRVAAVARRQAPGTLGSALG